MKKILLYSMTVLLTALVIAVIPTEADGAVYEDTVRLHILANSDSEEDQALKLKLRDDVLREFSDMLSKFDSADGARSALLSSLDDIEAFAEKRIEEYGYGYTVNATLTEEWYDTREYEDFTLPKGYYSSLQIIIGEGEGKNWWCVMYPPLCLDMAVEDAPRDDAIKKYNESEFRLVTGNGYQAKFKILELVSSVFS